MAALLHVRVVLPEEHRAPAVTFVTDHVAVTNIVHLAGVAVDPTGDVLLFDVAREAANEVVRVLRDMGVTERGSITIDHVRLSLGTGVTRAELAAEGDPDRVVVWAEIDADVEAGAHSTPSYLVYFAVAAIIAAAGILADSSILIVGAMVVGPEFGPLAAIAYGLERRRWWLVRRAIAALAAGTALAIVAAAAVADVLDLTDRIPDAYASGVRPLTSFISHPDLLSAIVAGAAAVAGMLSLTYERSGTLVGVLVSVTTVPAIANVGVAAAVGAWGEAWGALGQLGVNVACLVVVGAITLRIQRRLTPQTVSALPRRRP